MKRKEMTRILMSTMTKNIDLKRKEVVSRDWKNNGKENFSVIKVDKCLRQTFSSSCSPSTINDEQNRTTSISLCFLDNYATRRP